MECREIRPLKAAVVRCVMNWGWYPDKSENYGKIRHRVTLITQLQPAPSTTPLSSSTNTKPLNLLSLATHNSPQLRLDRFGLVRSVPAVVRLGNQVDRPTPLQGPGGLICSLVQDGLNTYYLHGSEGGCTMGPLSDGKREIWNSMEKRAVRVCIPVDIKWQRDRLVILEQRLCDPSTASFKNQQHKESESPICQPNIAFETNCKLLLHWNTVMKDTEASSLCSNSNHPGG
ncbi:hypothetical protein F5144DRAFT_301358 [Chaetomium tenue]|uniref:Uncharacterized protein n=1 Tax=Chaetomium tenue TaxID=1854479 RepID=A0ACB7P4Z2_9PEZI|nr:hypothetical protein F5144DRAFT_301358 [Chaetomium globosum]